MAVPSALHADHSLPQDLSHMRSRIADASNLSETDVLAWRELARSCAPQGNAFISPAFTVAASKAYRHVKVCFVEDASGIVAILPYQFLSPFAAAMGAAVRVGEEMSDQFSVVARAEFRCSPRDLLRLAKLNHLYFTHLEESQERHGLSGEKPSGGLRILLPNGGASYLEELRRSDPKFSKDTERRLRKAVQDLGPVQFRLEESDPAAWLPRVIAEKRAQYLRTKNMDWLEATGRTTLLETLAHLRDADCSPVVSTLMFGDQWAAIHFGLRSNKTLHYWFPVYNPELASYAPGRLLLHHVILHAQAAGLELIDRGEGESQAKRDFPSERHLFYSGVWSRPGARGFLYRAYQSAGWRLSRLQRK
jgi:CelD/BcsL family acetyltransferase involved in cellulose biosynthesis